MDEAARSGLLRPMTIADVPHVLEVQEPGAVVGLADVFDQDTHPFPRDAVAARWIAEIESPHIDCQIVQRHGVTAGFAAVRGDEFLHFGIALEHWGTGLAVAAHDAVLERLRTNGVQRAWLRVFAANGRGRAFYDKLGWCWTGERSFSSFAPYPELLRYERDL